VGKPEGWDHLKNLGVDGMIILKAKVKFSQEQAIKAQKLYSFFNPGTR
jgi:hypothetical protein